MFRMTNAVLIIIVLLVVAAGSGLYFSKKYRERAKEMESAYRLENQKTEIYKDKSNKWRGKAEAAAVSNNTLRKLARTEGSHYNQLRQEFRELKKSLKNLDHHTSTETKTIVEVQTLVHDTIYISRDGTRVEGKKFAWKDSSGFNKFKGTFFGDTLVGKLEVIDSLEIVTYWKRKVPVIGKKKYETQILSRNPNTKIVQIKYTVKKQKRK
jgi:type II secretory pathway pseudopilin PulG